MVTHPWTIRWWQVLSALALLNLGLWLLTVAAVPRGSAYTAGHLVLSGIYTAVCAYRSVLPRIDLERTVMLDHPLSSIVAGRSAATLAEVAFGLQVALALHELGAHVDLPVLRSAAPVVAIAIAIAQAWCWAGVATLNHLYHAIEESIWAVTFAGITALLVLAVGPAEGRLETLLAAGAVGTGTYVAFMVFVDVPMYLQRWREGRGSVLPWREGLRDALVRREPTRGWDVWRPEVAWLTAYFSVAVWASLALAWVPRAA